MSIIGILEKNIRNLGLNDEKAWDTSLWNLAGSQSLSGETVTEHTALTYSAVYNAISLISGTIGALPLHLMQRKGDKKRIADDRKLYRVMHDQWNPYMTAMAGREAMTAHVLAWGNGYAEKVFDGYGDVVQLWPITPDRVTPKMENGEFVYRVTMPTGAPVTLSREKVFHIPGLGFDGFTGYSVISMARKSIGLSMALETFGSLYFGKGTHPSAVVTHPGTLKDPQAVLTALNTVYGGLGNSNGLMLMQDGMTIQKIGIPPEDSQFLESRQHQIPEVARWFNIQPHKLKDLTKSSFSNIEQEQISFVVDCILPWLVRFEQNYQMQLLSPSDRNLSGYGRLYFKHSVEGLMRGDATSRAKLYQTLWGIGALSSNDVRALEDMDPIPGGDKYFVPLNMISLENAGNPPALPKPAELSPIIPSTPGNGKDRVTQDVKAQ